ncbi:hypothetical protein P3T76_008762 [Phytophthora citrophthora]|uniref:Uncharacterized protein n=1 Tax=Phytophthora citrophthora TaxID=4793 RepID=A0AAD9GJF5_9STRA|nr:hypothetical protein P3T76_008762 [Phytophthora citrophthora]
MRQEWVYTICTVVNAIKHPQCPNSKVGRPRDTWIDVASTVDDGKSTIVDEKNSTIPDQPSPVPVPEKLYYPISGEYYMGGDITIGNKFVTTVETWQVAYINDRRETPMGVEYQVVWVHLDQACKRLCMRSWEPLSKLKEDDFEAEIRKERAVKLLGRPDLVTEQEIKQFIDDRLVLYNQDLRAGATWIDVRDFMIRL